MTDDDIEASNKAFRAAIAQSRRRLAHYNKWLMDDSRPLGSSTYPGFPEDLDPSIIVDVETVDTKDLPERKKRTRKFEKPVTKKSNKKQVKKKA